MWRRSRRRGHRRAWGTSAATASLRTRRQCYEHYGGNGQSKASNDTHSWSVRGTVRAGEFVVRLRLERNKLHVNCDERLDAGAAEAAPCGRTSEARPRLEP